MRSLVRRQVDEGVHFLVPCGTTGESPTLSYEEHERVIDLVVAGAAGRVPVIVGETYTPPDQLMYEKNMCRRSALLR